MTTLQNRRLTNSFSFQRDHLYVLVGENGAGKSTLFHLIMRFLATQQRADLHGRNGDSDMVARNMALENISWVGQKPVIFNTSLFENVRLFDSSYTRNTGRRSPR